MTCTSWIKMLIMWSSDAPILYSKAKTSSISDSLQLPLFHWRKLVVCIQQCLFMYYKTFRSINKTVPLWKLNIFRKTLVLWPHISFRNLKSKWVMPLYQWVLLGVTWSPVQLPPPISFVFQPVPLFPPLGWQFMTTIIKVNIYREVENDQVIQVRCFRLRQWLRKVILSIVHFL